MFLEALREIRRGIETKRYKEISKGSRRRA